MIKHRILRIPLHATVAQIGEYHYGKINVKKEIIIDP
jgi:hypothetical protein